MREHAGGRVALALLRTVVVGRRVGSQEELALAIDHGIEQSAAVMRELWDVRSEIYERKNRHYLMG